MLGKIKVLNLLVIVSAFLMSIPFAVCANASSEYEGGLYSYQLAKIIQVPGRQGVATDGTHYYVSGSRALYKCDKSGEVILENKEPFKTFPEEAVCNHIGDIDYYNGELYIGAEEFKEGRGFNIQIAIYDAETLEYKRSIPFDEKSGQIEVCALDKETDEIIEKKICNPGDVIYIPSMDAHCIMNTSSTESAYFLCCICNVYEDDEYL